MNSETTAAPISAASLLGRHVLRVATLLGSGGILLSLALGLLLFPGSARAGTPEWMLFIGRFHPLVLHLPVALLLLLPLLHLLARVTPAGSLRPAIVLTLWLCAGSALVATACGLLLSQENGYAGETLLWHRRFAAGLTALAALLLVCESESTHTSVLRLQLARWSRNTYRTLLPLTLVCLGIAAHLGASVTHGSAFLTEHLKALAGSESLKKAAPTPPSDSAFTALVEPIFQEHCTSCHGLQKAKGGLRLNTLDAILAGGDSQHDGQPTVIPGRADDSLLTRSLRLPEDDDAHMPPAGKAQLTEKEIALLRWWINEGANAQTPASKAPAASLADGKPHPAPGT